jgi:glycosyltransferase involved in cell wall biosynthesis
MIEMGATPILSICIPTFQRKEALEKTLQGLIESEKLVAGKLEICISDNGSSDGTFEMLKDYAKRYSFIHIRKNPKNVGFDANLLASLKMAHGKYCWGIGDDDTIIPEGVRTFVTLLSEKGPFTMGLTGAMAHKRDSDLIAQYFPRQEYSNREFIDNLISLIHDSSRFVKSHRDITVLGFLPCYFFSNELLKHSFKQLEGKRYGWYHLALFLYELSNFEGTVLVNKEPPIKHGQDIVHKKDNVLFPGDEFVLFVDRRINALSDINIDVKLREAFYRWLNVRGNYFYTKSLVQLSSLSGMLNKTEYNNLKNKVYECKNRLKMPAFILLGTTFFRTMEPFVLFRRLVAAFYSKIHPVYVKQISDYLKGHLRTNDEREGNSTSISAT